MNRGEVFNYGFGKLGALDQVAIVEGFSENTSIPLFKGVVLGTLLEVFEGLG